MVDTVWTIDPGRSCGPLIFGMSELRVSAELSRPEYAPFLGECEFDAGQLVAVRFYCEDQVPLKLGSVLISELHPLERALALARLSGSAGQAQGGSLYFDAIHMALLQFETHVSQIAAHAKNFDHNEPLRPMTEEDIKDYYYQQTEGMSP